MKIIDALQCIIIDQFPIQLGQSKHDAHIEEIRVALGTKTAPRLPEVQYKIIQEGAPEWEKETRHFFFKPPHVLLVREAAKPQSGVLLVIRTIPEGEMPLSSLEDITQGVQLLAGDAELLTLGTWNQQGHRGRDELWHVKGAAIFFAYTAKSMKGTPDDAAYANAKPEEYCGDWHYILVTQESQVFRLSWIELLEHIAIETHNITTVVTMFQAKLHKKIGELLTRLQVNGQDTIHFSTDLIKRSCELHTGGWSPPDFKNSGWIFLSPLAQENISIHGVEVLRCGRFSVLTPGSKALVGLELSNSDGGVTNIEIIKNDGLLVLNERRYKTRAIYLLGVVEKKDWILAWTEARHGRVIHLCFADKGGMYRYVLKGGISHTIAWYMIASDVTRDLKRDFEDIFGHQAMQDVPAPNVPPSDTGQQSRKTLDF